MYKNPCFHLLTLLLLIPALAISMVSCNKNSSSTDTPYLYGVLVDPQNQTTHLEGQVISIESTSKTSYSIFVGDTFYSTTPIYEVPLSSLVLFFSKNLAQQFAEKYAPYIGVYLSSTESKTLYIHRDINASKTASIHPLLERKIINPLEESTSIQVLNDNEIVSHSYWVEVQYYDEEVKKYQRGWELITNSSQVIYTKKNETNPSLLLENLQTNVWKRIRTGTEKNPFYDSQIILEIDQNNITNQSLSIIHQTNTYQQYSINTNISSLIPTGIRRAIIPSKNIEISWYPERKLIDVIYADLSRERYIPAPLETKRITPSETQLYRERIYKVISQGASLASSKVSWFSHLYGTMDISIIPGSFQFNVDWKLNSDIAKLYFPPNTDRIRGIFSFTHIPAKEYQDQIDGIVTFSSLDIPEDIYLGIKIINDFTVGYQFIPEANVLGEIHQSPIITAPPAQPRLVFQRAP